MKPLRSLKLRVADLGDRLSGRSSDLVPSRRLNYVGTGDFVKTGDEFLRYFRELGELKPSDDVLDIGCGIGRMARPLTTYLDADGSYTGFDIVSQGIEWCQSRYAGRFTNFKFDLVEVENPKYNADASALASEFTFPYPDDSFDFVFATSVFTHLQERATARYLAEATRVLRSEGRLFVTFFLLNEESRKLVRDEVSSLRFEKLSDVVATTNRQRPEEAVAFDETWIRGQLQDLGLVEKTFEYGNWADRVGRTLQDIVVATNLPK